MILNVNQTLFILSVAAGLMPFFSRAQTINKPELAIVNLSQNDTRPNLLKLKDLLLTKSEEKLVQINPKVFKNQTLMDSLQSNKFKVGGGDAGGGNSTAIRFVALTSQAIHTFDEKKLPADVTKQSMLKALHDAKILVTHSELFVEDPITGGLQPCEVINFPTLQTIIISENKFNSIGEAYIAKRLGIHEVLSLMNVESTGIYRISSMSDDEFKFLDFSFDNLPLGTKFVFTRAIPFNFKVSYLSFAPNSGYNFVLENPTNGRNQIIVQPRTCLLESIDDNHYFKKYGQHPSVNRLFKFGGDSVCGAMNLIFWPSDINNGRNKAWYPIVLGRPQQSFELQSSDLASELGIQIIIQPPEVL